MAVSSHSIRVQAQTSPGFQGPTRPVIFWGLETPGAAYPLVHLFHKQVDNCARTVLVCPLLQRPQGVAAECAAQARAVV